MMWMWHVEVALALALFQPRQNFTTIELKMRRAIFNYYEARTDEMRNRAPAKPSQRKKILWRHFLPISRHKLDRAASDDDHLP
jgi:hypothetical protein